MPHSFKAAALFILLVILCTIQANAQQHLQTVTYDAKEQSYSFRTNENKLLLKDGAGVAPSILGIKKVYTSKEDAGSFYMTIFVRVKSERTHFTDSNTTFLITFVDSTQKRFACDNDTAEILSPGEEDYFYFSPDDKEDREKFKSTRVAAIDIQFLGSHVHYPLNEDGQLQFQQLYTTLMSQEVYNKYDWAIKLQNNEINYYRFGVTTGSKDKLEGYFNKSGQLVSPLYTSAHYFDPIGLARVMPVGETKSGFIDTTFKLVIPAQFDDGFDYWNGGLSCVNKDGYYGLINTKGEFVVPPLYYRVFSFCEGLALVIKNDKTGFVNRLGKVVIPLQFDDGNSFSEGLAPVKTSNGYGFIHKDGSFAITPQFEYASEVEAGLAMIKKGGAYGFIDTTGAVVIAPVYSNLRDFYQGLAAAVKGGKWGYIDKTGTTVIDIKYDYAGPFIKGIAPVKVGTKYGYIGLDGNVIITPQFDYADELDENGKAEVKLNGQKGVIKFHY